MSFRIRTNSVSNLDEESAFRPQDFGDTIKAKLCLDW